MSEAYVRVVASTDHMLPNAPWRSTTNYAVLVSGDFFSRAKKPVTTTPSNATLETLPTLADETSLPPVAELYVPILPRRTRKSLVVAIALFLLTLCTCLAAGTQFAVAYSHHEAASFDEFGRAFALFYKNPAGLLAGLPFAATLLTILLAHELGHFFACRRHQIHSTYPFFLLFPSLIGTFGAFILIRSPIRTARALFDVGASGPIVGFVFAVPALLYGVLHSTVVPALAHPDPEQSIVFGSPLLLRFLDSLFHPGINPNMLLLPPIGRAAWVGLFATSLNLLPTGQLDGGHILRSLNPRLHRIVSWLVPILLLALGAFLNLRATGSPFAWSLWYLWGGLLLTLRLFFSARTALLTRRAATRGLISTPIYDPIPLDPPRQILALITLLILILSFIPSPVSM